MRAKRGIPHDLEAEGKCLKKGGWGVSAFWRKGDGTVSAKLCSLQRIFVSRTINKNKTVQYNNFLHEVERSWITEFLNLG
jgi:hypothetical protein